MNPLLNRFSSHFQRLGLKPVINEKATEEQRQVMPGEDPNDPNAPKKPEPFWRTFTFSYERRGRRTKRCLGLLVLGFD